MTATERREEIMKIMVARIQENMTNLARELGVTTRTQDLISNPDDSIISQLA